uniref:Tight adherence protein B n=2 Tax=Micromonospora robiginosa TaxID=2749844 RepID=A0A7L6BEE1_9ACTN
MVGVLLGGPVAALVLAAYGALAARAALRRRAHRAADLAHRRELDRLGAAAADLRAGLPTGAVLDEGTGRIARLCRAAVCLADRTGAPLADLLERIEADARAADRGLAAAAAQAAGARATAWLLAALPLGGIGLGYAIGVDPVAVLLHTPVGGGSAVAAVVLQIGGLLWAERLGVGPGRAA